MPGRKLRLRVLTPDRASLEREAGFIVLRAAGGDMGILPGHEPCAVMLDTGILRAYAGYGQWERPYLLAVLGGFATVRGDEVVVMSAVAERPEELEAVLARMERERAESRRDERIADFEMQRVEAALRRSLVKMDVSAYSVLRGREDQS